MKKIGYYLERKGYGKYIYYKVKSISGKKLEGLKRKGIETYDTYSQAHNKVIEKKK